MRSQIAQPWGISVFGQGDVHAEPDHASLRLALNRLSKKPEESLQKASSAAALVRQTASSHGVLDSDVTSSRTSIHTAWDGHGAGRKFLGHQCRIEFSIQIRNLDAVEAVLAALVEAGADEIMSVQYDTGEKPALRSQARQIAVEAATVKAELYADAAGTKLGPVIHIEDVDPEGLRPEFRSRGAGGGSEDGGLVPGRVTVEAAVMLGFSIAH